ncbi:efflux transporter, outer membrane factor (OMF) lipoprotein, NodT family [Aeromonas sp. RU39B]|uniref:efflux transporter outer membrane subunit n=1 Tax=Aeromonas sp. RU39B TaxID=1907416 RepID=UPI0009568AE8|nr:efflux transporter outer membrane subunit [Aeromonas sp. RU39B]SIR57385.1 efflux transporter, outer membrane factor (OMF) lipoprotein, NodT family [Aeromonas sp. RU39B]
MRSGIFLLSAVAGSLLLAGCAAPDNIRAHNQPGTMTELASGQSFSHLSAAAWPNEQWWSGFHDTQLNALITEALKSNPDLQLANARLAQAEAGVDASDALLEPVLGANAGLTRVRLSKLDDYRGVGHVYGTERNLGLSFNYSFDLWGGKRAAWEASVNNAKAAEVDRRAADILLTGSIVRTYVQLANAYVMEDLAKKDLERTGNMASITERLLQNGLTSEDRLYTAQSAEASARQVLKQRSLSVEQFKNTLAALLGAGPDRALTIARPTLTLDASLALPGNLPAELLSHRPDIVAAKWRVEAANKEIASAKTEFYPNLNLSAAAGVKSLVGDSFFGATSQYGSVGPALSLPLYQSELKANLKSKTADYDLAVAQYNQTLVKSLEEVNDKVLILKSIAGQIDDANQSVQLAEHSYQITENRYQAGMGSQLEVLMAEQQLLQAESVASNLQAQQQDAKVQLIQSLGGGFSLPSNNEHQRG